MTAWPRWRGIETRRGSRGDDRAPATAAGVSGTGRWRSDPALLEACTSSVVGGLDMIWREHHWLYGGGSWGILGDLELEGS